MDWGKQCPADTTEHQARCDESLDGQPWSPRQVAEIVDQADDSQQRGSSQDSPQQAQACVQAGEIQVGGDGRWQQVIQ